MSEAALDFTLYAGGPFYQLVRRLGLVAPNGAVRAGVLALIAWLPIVIGEAARLAIGMPGDPIVQDLSLHVRPLVAIPAMFFAGHVVDPACRSAIRSLDVGGICDHAELEKIVDRGTRMRDAWWPEVGIAVVAAIGGQLALWRVTGSTGVVHGAGVGRWSFPHLWYVMFALPLTQFVMVRWLWRWLIWTVMLAMIARRPLALLATHPDRAAGLSCVARPVFGFGCNAFAQGAVLSSAWSSQQLAYGVAPREHLLALAIFLIAITMIAVGPLLLFCGHLFRARRRAIAEYGDFAFGYVRSFHDKWIVSGVVASEALGSGDIQALNDLGGSYSVVTTTRLVVFGPRSVIVVWLGALLPMLPLFASFVTAEQLLRQIVKTVLGGLPI